MKQQGRLFYLLVALFLMAGTWILSVRFVQAAGSCGESITWTLEGDTIVIDDNITYIGSGAFYNFARTNIDSETEKPSLILNFPRSVTSVGASAFVGYAEGVERVYTRNTVTETGENCFGALGIPKLYGAAGSKAEAYAAQNNLEFFVWNGISTHYTVTFDSKGGSAVEQQQVQIGNKATEPPAPVRDGYHFNGWFLGEERYDFREAVHKDIILTARWSEVIITGEAPVLTLQNESDWSVEEIRLSWTLCDTANLRGYDIYRAEGEDGEYEIIDQLSAFVVEVPEEENENTAEISLQNELFYFYQKDEKINVDFEVVEKGAV